LKETTGNTGAEENGEQFLWTDRFLYCLAKDPDAPAVKKNVKETAIVEGSVEEIKGE
jgi:hypothetical protein